MVLQEYSVHHHVDVSENVLHGCTQYSYTACVCVCAFLLNDYDACTTLIPSQVSALQTELQVQSKALEVCNVIVVYFHQLVHNILT